MNSALSNVNCPMPMGEEDNSKKREGEKEERMGLPSREQAPGPASPLQTHGRKERKRREDRMVSSHLKRGWPALLITLTLRNQEKPIYLKTKAFDKKMKLFWNILSLKLVENTMSTVLST